MNTLIYMTVLYVCSSQGLLISSLGDSIAPETGLSDRAFGQVIEVQCETGTITMGNRAPYGTIVDTESKPVLDIQCSLLRFDRHIREWRLLAQVRSDRSGEFSFPALEFEFDIHRFGYACVVQGRGYSTSFIALDFSDGNPLSEIEEIVLSAPKLIEGHVTDTNGDPIPNCLVYSSIFERSNPLVGMCSTRTDEHGHFVIADISPTQGDRPEDERTSATYPSLIFEKAGFARFEDCIPVDKLRDITVRLQETVEISGRLVDEDGRPVHNALVCAEASHSFGDSHNQGSCSSWHVHEKPRESYHTFTDQDGRYVFEKLKSDVWYEAAIESENGFARSQRFALRRNDDSILLSDFVLTEGVIVEGQVIWNDTGKELQLAANEVVFVSSVASTYGYKRARVSLDGKFRIRAHPLETTLIFKDVTSLHKSGFLGNFFVKLSSGPFSDERQSLTIKLASESSSHYDD